MHREARNPICLMLTDRLRALCDIATTVSVLACRMLVEEGVDAVQPFQGRRLMGALCGKTVTTNPANHRQMVELCEQHELKIWLPSGDDFDVGDGCVISPGAATCSALAQPANRSISSSRSLPRQQWQSSRFLSRRPIWLACSRPCGRVLAL